MPLKYLIFFIYVFMMHCCVSKGGQYLHIETVYRTVKDSIVMTDERTKSLVQCAFQCKRRFGLSLYYNDQDQTCTCNKDLDTSNVHNPDLAPRFYGHLTELPVTIQSPTQHPGNLVTTIPRQDCNKHKEAGHSDEGVYPLYINATGSTVYVRCILPGGINTGPLTVFQSRYSGSLDFYRPWSEYVSGFGNASHETEYWLGLEHIATLTNNNKYGLYIHLTIDEPGSKIFASLQFKEFRLVARQKYRMILYNQQNVGGGCAKELDEYKVGTGMMFSTFDADNDHDDSTNCSELFKTAWWFGRGCETFQLNGPMLEGPHGMPILSYQPCWGNNKIIQTEMSLISDG